MDGVKASTCDLCPEPAVWLWDPGVTPPFLLCDGCAAEKDLDDLDDLAGVGEP